MLSIFFFFWPPMAFPHGRLSGGVRVRGPGAQGGEKHVCPHVLELGKPGKTVLVMGLHQWGR